MMFAKHTLFVLSLSAVLAACGGGGGGEDDNSNKPPIANAGTTINAVAGQVITLDGTKSSDPENQNLTYKWILTSKPTDSAVYFDEPETANPVLSNIRAGTYVAQLIVNDGVQDSTPATVNIEVAATLSAPPRAPTAGEIKFMADTILNVFPNYLRSPSSFKLIEGPTWAYYDNIGKPAEGAFTLKYDAMNGFGATIRGTAICPAEWDSRGFWRNEINNDLRLCVFL